MLLWNTVFFRVEGVFKAVLGVVVLWIGRPGYGLSPLLVPFPALIPNTPLLRDPTGALWTGCEK